MKTIRARWNQYRQDKAFVRYMERGIDMREDYFLNYREILPNVNDNGIWILWIWDMYVQEPINKAEHLLWVLTGRMPEWMREDELTREIAMDEEARLLSYAR